MENNFKRKLMAFWLFLWVGIPFMLAQSPMMISGRITDDLGETFRCEAQGACDPCRIGVRLVPREISASGDGFVRSDAARRPFAR